MMNSVNAVLILLLWFWSLGPEMILIPEQTSVTGAERTKAHAELCEACFKGDIDRINALILSGIDLKTCKSGVDRFTLPEFGEFSRIDLASCGPIQCCIIGELATSQPHAKTLAIIKELIKAGADVNQKSIICKTALMDAAYLGNLDIVRTLLDAGANVCLRTRLSLDSPIGRNALHFAVLSNGTERKEIIHELLEAGINPMERDSSGATPAILARRAFRPDLADQIGRIVSGIEPPQ